MGTYRPSGRYVRYRGYMRSDSVCFDCRHASRESAICPFCRKAMWVIPKHCKVPPKHDDRGWAGLRQEKARQREWYDRKEVWKMKTAESLIKRWKKK